MYTAQTMEERHAEFDADAPTKGEVNLAADLNAAVVRDGTAAIHNVIRKAIDDMRRGERKPEGYAGDLRTAYETACDLFTAGAFDCDHGYGFDDSKHAAWKAGWKAADEVQRALFDDMCDSNGEA